LNNISFKCVLGNFNDIFGIQHDQLLRLYHYSVMRMQ
jgi:hypothetical protein